MTAILTSHNKSQLKQHEPSLPDSVAKQQCKGRRCKKQAAAVGIKHKPAGKATSKWHSQRLSGKCAPLKQQKQENKRIRMPVEDQRAGSRVLAAAAEFEVDASSTAGSRIK